jgi:2'-5' RNA ligase
METFFGQRWIWPGGGPYPHFLITLDESPEYKEYAHAARKHLLRYDRELGIIPDPWLHITVQGLFREAGAQQLDVLRATAREQLRGMQAFQVEVGPVIVGDASVTAYLYPKHDLAELTRRARVAATQAGLELREADDVYSAHTALAYSRQSWDSRELARAFKPEPVERVKFTVDHVYLVSQRQDPQKGLFTWDKIERFPLQEPPHRGNLGGAR